VENSLGNPASKERYNDQIPMRYLHGNAQHIGSRNYQQDFFGFSDPEGEAFQAHGGFLAVVCDGMGGMEHGDIASQTAVRTVIEAYGRKTPEESIPQALERSVYRANERVLAAAQSLGVAEGAGTTLVAAVLHGTSLYYISVGDSALFHLSKGRLRMVNRPHVYANLLEQAVASGDLSREAAASHPEREALTSYIGVQALKEVDRNTAPRPVRDGETILLATDGMFKTLDPVEMRSCLAGHPQSWPAALVKCTLDKREEMQDNVTVVSVTLQSAPGTIFDSASDPAKTLMSRATRSSAGFWRRWWL
jgi:serine/threonine protein phosphatase PrpC